MISLSTQQRQQQWDEILQLSADLKSKFASESWDEINDLGERRQRKLESFFTTPVSEEEAGVIAEQISQIMQRDAQMMQQGRALQADILNEVKKISSRRQAINAYEKVQK